MCIMILDRLRSLVHHQAISVQEQTARHEDPLARFERDDCASPRLARFLQALLRRRLKADKSHKTRRLTPHKQ